MNTSLFKNVVTVIAPIGRESFSKFLQDVQAYLATPSSDSLTIIFTSGGGAAYYGMAFYEVIRMIPRPIVTFAIGFTDSAAILPFMAGDQRIATPETTFSFHVPSQTTNMRLSLQEVNQSAQDMNSFYGRYSSLIADRSGKVSVGEIETIQQKAEILEGEALIEKGIIHMFADYYSPISNAD